MQKSIAENLALADEETKELFYSKLSPEEKQELLYSYSFWARPNQLEPKDNYLTWLILSGRGYGKTWVGSHWVIEKARKYKGCHIGLIGESSADIRDIMVENGYSSILKQSSNTFYPKYEPSKRRLTFPNGSVATLYSADKPGLLRGPQHHFLWFDELAKYYNPYEVFDQAMFGLRLGTEPKLLITTTPKPIQLLKDLLQESNTIVTSGSTFENVSNLSGSFLTQIKKRYEGTTLGQQELYGNLLDEAEGALWTRKLIDDSRTLEPESFDEIVIGVDIAITSKESSDETGIIVCGKVGDKGYVLDDISGKLTPSEMAEKTIQAYWLWGASKVSLEINQGGDFIVEAIRMVEKQKGLTVPINIKPVWASKSKLVRASIIYPLYEQKRIHHCKSFNQLEDQMCTWIPGESKSPDRLDSLVWALTELFIKPIETEVYENNLW